MPDLEVERTDSIDDTTAYLEHALSLNAQQVKVARGIIKVSIEKLQRKSGLVSPRGATLLRLERLRQMDKKGYSSDHDDAHEEFEITRAAICYAAEAADMGSVHVRDLWPWEASSYPSVEGKGTQRLLEIAGALIAAEIDRAQRVGWELSKPDDPIPEKS